MLKTFIWHDGPNYLRVTFINYKFELPLMKTSIDFKTYLKNRWNQIYTSPDAKFIFTGEVESIKARKDGEIYLLLNDARKNKNVHSLNPTKVEVFKPFDPTKFNFNKGTEKQLLFYVNFDSEEVVTREAVRIDILL